MKRHPTKYPGVFYRVADRIGRSGKERVYYIVFKKDGKVIEEKVGRQYAEAMTEAKAALIRAERIENKRPSPKEVREKRKAIKWTLNELWISYCEFNAGNKGLVHEKNRWKKNVESGIGKKEPCDLSPLDIDRLRLGLQKSGKLTTAVRILELLRRTINFGVKRNLVEQPKFKIVLPKLNNQTTEDLTPEELGRLLKVLDEDEDQFCANLFRLALFTGMRRGELLGLTWDSVDFEKGFITIRDPKGGRDQSIPLNDNARAILKAHPRIGGVNWVFPGRHSGKHATEFRKSIDRIRRTAQLPEGFRPLHGLRHVYASMLASSGKVDMYTLQKLLTHKSPQMTQRYAHLRDDALKRAADLAGRIITEAAASKKTGDNDATEPQQDTGAEKK